MNPEAILTTAYLPPIQYISKFFLYNKIYLEAQENFQKQSYRNRCTIFGANGPQVLSIPVQINPGKKSKIKEVKIDYSKNWQKNHWKSITSAYNRSPFFEFYQDEFYPLYHGKKEVYLFDFNQKLLDIITQHIHSNAAIVQTKQYNKSYSEIDDYRTSIHPKKRMQIPDLYFQPTTYIQVFSTKHVFVPNLSIIDLLCNEGPESTIIMQKCIKKG